MKLLQGASLRWHPAEWEKIPWCIALVIFSSNRTCYHPRSQHCWRVCAPFRTDLNTSWKLTQSLLWCMNINVTSDRVQQEMGKYQFIMSSGLGQTISHWTYLTFSPRMNRSVNSPRSCPSGGEVIVTKQCNQYTIIPRTDTSRWPRWTSHHPWGLWMVNNESLH